MPAIGQLGRGQAENKTPPSTGTERAPAGSVQDSYISSKIFTGVHLIFRKNQGP
jgi:hypothetical protein